MDPIVSYTSLYISLVVLFAFCRGISAASLTIINRCEYTVWPGILSNAGSAVLDSTGFELQQGKSRSFQAPPNWSGRFWGRTGCTFDPNNGQGSCVTGDCGSNQVECNGAGATPPATLAEFTIGSGATQDFYDVSLVDGYNVPMIVDTSGGSGTCLSTGCVTDLNRRCPKELLVGDGAACKSACEAFGSPEYCCSGAYGSPATCKPSIYSEMFKAACPRSYSYAYDDATSTFTCTGADYTITFCPSGTSQKSARDASPTTNSSGTESQDVVPNEDNSPSWLPNFFSGDSSKTLSPSASVIASLASFLSLFLLHS
ncbi:thaumatin-like protein 1 isoform X1 [Juglans microcarpa x Juglans regia]|uniref:thaumatin-like protein 1 isoform X1 n=1 Tax=Juglans microcarpa x Juglans regia TaxID=2249226 RepID=UPI001B7F0033|nr:thaumatin-like protein 1 isoform X1 [Juglans microcarpa x Juglans regia]XP_041021761.1 thaumatin-like protein 1 isoform X1 [Juglans microcarpa x Juglans regia]